MNAVTIKQKLGATLAAGALAATGLIAVQAASAAPAEAAVCGSTSQSAGYAYANNPCGYAQAEVGRIINGQGKIAGGVVWKKGISASWTAGSRWYELTARW